MKVTPRSCANAIKLLERALYHAKLGCDDPVIEAGCERGIKLGGVVWEIAWLARVEAKARGHGRGWKLATLRSERVIAAAIALLEKGWEPKA